MPRFFRTLSKGVFDIEDLKFRRYELADLIQICSLHYKFNLKQKIAAGFSNGANIASSIALLRADRFQSAILSRTMVSLISNPLKKISKKRYY